MPPVSDENKVNYENASIVVNNLISCEHYKKNIEEKDSALVPFLSSVSFIVEKNSVVGIGADNKNELDILIEILGNMRPYYKGVVKLSNLGTKVNKKVVLEKLFYLDSHEMVYEDMTLLKQLMFIELMVRKGEKINYGYVEKDVLDIIVASGLSNLVNTKIKKLSNSTKMVIAILIALMSNSEKIVINANKYVFNQEDCERLAKIFKYFKERNKTIVIATMEEKLIGMCCDKVIYINHGTVKANCTVEDLYKKWDKVVCSIKGEDGELEDLSRLIKEKFKGATTTLLDGVLYVKKYGDDEILKKDIYDLALDNNIDISFIRFNSGRVENAFNEIKETFNDIYE